MRTVLAIWFFC